MPNEIEMLVVRGYEAVAAGDWSAAREAFAAALEAADPPAAMFVLAMSLWWLGNMVGSVAAYERAYSTSRHGPDPTLAAAARCGCASTTSSTSRIGRPRAGGLARAARLIDDAELTHLTGHLLVMKAYESEDPVAGETWAREAVRLARESKDNDLELCALSQIGASLVGQGRVSEGMALLDEAMAGALGGEGGQLDTVVFTSCNTMVACTSCADFERAAEWVRATDRSRTVTAVRSCTPSAARSTEGALCDGPVGSRRELGPWTGCSCRPVRSVDARPNPKYFGRRRGITWLNMISDQAVGLARAWPGRSSSAARRTPRGGPD